jgi:hypothetical protein
MLFCEIKLLNLKLPRIKRENASKKDCRDRVVCIKKYLSPGEGIYRPMLSGGEI